MQKGTAVCHGKREQSLSGQNETTVCQGKGVQQFVKVKWNSSLLMQKGTAVCHSKREVICHGKNETAVC